MADALRNVLLGDALQSAQGDARSRAGSVALEYLTDLAAQPPSAIESTEPKRLAAQAHSLLISIQELSKRSHAAIVASAVSYASLARSLPVISSRSADLGSLVPKLEQDASSFQARYDRSRPGGENARLESRKRALLLLRNVERSVDVMELPTLLSSALSATPPNFSSALDIYSHTRRLHSLYPASPLVTGIAQQAEQTMRRMAAELLIALKAPSAKSAASLRLVGWLRRILPDLEPAFAAQEQPGEAVLAAVFLLSRLYALVRTLDALEPLQVLADRERDHLARQNDESGGYDDASCVPTLNLTPSTQTWSTGQHTERFLKRYIEIFREQSFGILSMYQGVFSSTPSDYNVVTPSLTPTTTSRMDADAKDCSDGLSSPPLALASFPLHLSQMLLETLRCYLPVVRDQASRDGVIIQAMYCAGSLGRLGCDFGMLLADMGLTGQSPLGMVEWVEVVRHHRLLSGRLESGVRLQGTMDAHHVHL